jgi:hypothetical protein
MARFLVTASCVAAILGGWPLGSPARAAAQAGPAAEAAVAPTTLHAYDREAIEARWGVQIQSLDLTAAGYMLDLRYKVTDAAKAQPLFDRRVKPRLTDEKTGAVMAVPVPPKTGALRSVNDAREGRIYSMFFANPAHFIARFSRVTVTVGEFSVSGLVVR